MLLDFACMCCSNCWSLKRRCWWLSCRGSFEISRSGGSCVDLCGGVQAHLSSCVSPRVPQVARRFPQRLSLDQVPRSAAWPTHFHASGAKEDNIALYFFAKDLDRSFFLTQHNTLFPLSNPSLSRTATTETIRACWTA